MRGFLIRTAAFLLASQLLVAGCGKKTPPVPPQVAVPAAISDLKYELDPEGVTLSWSWPRLTEKGAQLRRVRQFIVERSEERASDFCPDCPRRYSQAGLVEGGSLPEKSGIKPLVFRDQNLRSGYHYSYRVRSSLGWRVISAPSEPAEFFWQVGLAGPENLTARAGEWEVALEWQPPKFDLEGEIVSEPLIYQVYRREDGGPFQFLAEIKEGNSYLDQRVNSGVGYEYRVRAARARGGTGAFSLTAEAKPCDLTPPPPPSGLTAVVVREEVRLYWQPLTVDDLDGYRIYRRRTVPGSSDQSVLIGKVGARANSFTDSTPFSQVEKVRYYSIRAFDRASPANLSDFSEEIETSTTSMTP